VTRSAASSADRRTWGLRALATAACALVLVCVAAAPARADETCGSLVSAFAGASSGDTITLGAGLSCSHASLGLSAGDSLDLPTGIAITFQGGGAGATLDFGDDTAAILLGTDVKGTVIRNLTFRDGTATGSTVNGGAINIGGDSFPTLEGDQFYGNTADSAGGAVQIGVTDPGADAAPVVIKDSIFGSLADPNSSSFGGGLSGGGPRPFQVSGSQFVGNIGSSRGGGANLTTSSPIGLTVSSTLFDRNSSTASGGGLQVGTSEDVTLIANTFSGNAVFDPSPGGASQGGGLDFDGESSVTPGTLSQSSNLFQGNTVTFGASTTLDAAGAGEFAAGKLFVSRGDRFVGNELQVPMSSGEAAGAGLSLEGCGSTPAPGEHSVENGVFAGNRFTGSGDGEREAAGLYTGCGAGPVNLTLRDSTIAGNDAGGSGTSGLFGGPDDTLDMQNTIVAANPGGTDLSGFSSMTVGFSDACPLPSGTGNFCSNPLLLNAGAGDVHQTAASPTLEKGSNTQIPAGLVTDFENDNRIQGPTVDIGADEGPFNGPNALLTLDTVAPGVSGASIGSVFAVGSKPTSINARRRKVKRGTTIRYTLSEAATVRLRIDRRLKGRKVGKRCRKPTRRNRTRRRCTRFKRAGTLTRTGKVGKNRVKFSGRIGSKALKRGKYRLTITATDPAGNKSKPKRLKFRIVKP
jgi:hypothetical protein